VTHEDLTYACAIPSYSLDIEIPGEDNRYVPLHDFPNELPRVWSCTDAFVTILRQ
jgi:hypothetical protein